MAPLFASACLASAYWLRSAVIAGNGSPRRWHQARQIALQALHVLVARAPFGGERAGVHELFVERAELLLVDQLAVRAEDLVLRLEFFDAVGAVRRPVAQLGQARSSAPVVRLLASVLDGNCPLDIDARDGVGEARRLGPILRRDRDVDHKGLVGPSRAHAVLQDAGRLQDAIFLPELPNSDDRATTTRSAAPRRIPIVLQLFTIDHWSEHAAGRDDLQLAFGLRRSAHRSHRSARGIRSPCITCSP